MYHTFITLVGLPASSTSLDQNEIGPDGCPVGALRVGAPKAAADTVGSPDFAVAPKPGQLVLLPSYFAHWTVPLGKTSIADFNCIRCHRFKAGR
jgi:hypothetical protein